MKSHLQILLAILALGVVAACQKERASDPVIPTDGQILFLVDQAWDGMASPDQFPENPTLGILMQHDGISADFLVDETYLDTDQSHYGGNPESRISIRDHSFIGCLRDLQLTPDQTLQIRELLLFYGACKDRAITRAREIYRDLRNEYQSKFLRLLAAYRNGAITEREFRQMVSDLRSEFRTELRRLHLRERLDMALKQCLWDCLSGIHGILTDRQWNAFVECCRRR